MAETRYTAGGSFTRPIEAERMKVNWDEPGCNNFRWAHIGIMLDGLDDSWVLRKTDCMNSNSIYITIECLLVAVVAVMIRSIDARDNLLKTLRKQSTLRSPVASAASSRCGAVQKISVAYVVHAPIQPDVRYFDRWPAKADCPPWKYVDAPVALHLPHRAYNNRLHGRPQALTTSRCTKITRKHSPLISSTR